MGAAEPPLRGAAQTGAIASLQRATSQALRASLQVEAALAGKAPALLCRRVPEEGLAARVHWAVGMGSRGMTATPGGGWPSRALVPTGSLLAAADRGQTAPMAADTGPPATRGTAALTQGDDPLALMVIGGPPAPAPCLDAPVVPEVAPLCTTPLLDAPPLVPETSGTLPLVGWGAALTAVGLPAAPLRLVCHLTLAWERS